MHYNSYFAKAPEISKDTWNIKNKLCICDMEFCKAFGVIKDQTIQLPVVFNHTLVQLTIRQEKNWPKN